jgi:hypothetical protein
MIVRRSRSRRAKIREQPCRSVRIDLRKGEQAAYRAAISRIQPPSRGRLIGLVEVKKKWSFGNGVAQYA